MLPSWLAKKSFYTCPRSACKPEPQQVRQTVLTLNLFLTLHIVQFSVFTFRLYIQSGTRERLQWKCYHQRIYHTSHVLYHLTNLWFYSKTRFWQSMSLCLDRSVQEKSDKPELKTRFSSLLNLFFLVLSPDPLRSGQGRRHPLQHHRSRRWSAPEWDLQHRPHQWQHVCHPTPRQRGESLLPCKEEISVFLFPI